MQGMERGGWIVVAGLAMAAVAAAQQGAPAADTAAPAAGLAAQAEEHPDTQQEGQQGASPHLKLIPRSHDQRETAYHTQHRIILNAQVTDAKGRPAVGLTQGDFTLMDGERPAKIASFRESGTGAITEQAHVLLVVDAVNNSSRVLAIERRELEKFFERSRGQLKLPVGLVVLSESGARTEHATSDVDVLLAQLRDSTANLHAMECGDEGGALAERPQGDSHTPQMDLSPRESVKERERKAECLNNKFVASVTALNHLARQQVDVPGRAIVIWLGAGWPLLLGPEFRADTPTDSRKHFDYLSELSASLREAQMTLDSVSSPDLFHKPEAGAERLISVAPPAADQASTADFALPLLVRQTGGRVLEESKDLGAEIAACIADAESYYVLAFDSPPGAGTGEYRTVEVKVNKPGLTVRTNAAYFAQP